MAFWFVAVRNGSTRAASYAWTGLRGTATAIAAAATLHHSLPAAHHCKPLTDQRANKKDALIKNAVLGAHCKAMSELSEAARDLLPKSADEFGTVGYWDAFYQKRGDAVFHWYVDGARGAALVDAALADVNSSDGERLVVNLGCGTCEVPRGLAERWRGPHKLRVLSVDVSEECVTRSRAAQQSTDLVALDFAVMDALALPDVADASVDVIFDKGLVDALHPRDDDASRRSVRKLFATLKRVLKPGGCVVLVSMLQGHIRSLVERACDGAWSVDAAPASTERATLVPFCLRLRCEHETLVVELNVGLRGRRNGLDAAEEVVTKLRGVAGLRWATEPKPKPLAFGVHAVAGAVVVGEDDDADDVRDRLGEALGCEAVDDDAASTSSESDGDEEAPLRMAWPEVVSVRSGQVR